MNKIRATLASQYPSILLGQLAWQAAVEGRTLKISARKVRYATEMQDGPSAGERAPSGEESMTDSLNLLGLRRVLPLPVSTGQRLPPSTRPLGTCLFTELELEIRKRTCSMALFTSGSPGVTDGSTTNSTCQEKNPEGTHLFIYASSLLFV